MFTLSLLWSRDSRIRDRINPVSYSLGLLSRFCSILVPTLEEHRTKQATPTSIPLHVCYSGTDVQETEMEETELQGARVSSKCFPRRLHIAHAEPPECYVHDESWKGFCSLSFESWEPDTSFLTGGGMRRPSLTTELFDNFLRRSQRESRDAYRVFGRS